MLEERQMPYVLAVPVNQRLIATVEDKVTDLRGDALAARLPGQAWKTISAGAGFKGPRQYHWAKTAVRPLEDTCSYWLLGHLRGAAWPIPPTWPTTLPRPRTHPAG
jgi:hypothetical protein